MHTHIRKIPSKAGQVGANWGSKKGKKLRGTMNAALQSSAHHNLRLERQGIRLWLELPPADGAHLMSIPTGVDSTAVSEPTSL